eukprot:XP_762848.1 hypothetical protein [Theileria parva strain Muguga]
MNPPHRLTLSQYLRKSGHVFRILMLFKKIQKFINLRRFFSVNIPVKKLQVTTSRSSGPGGQSVNKILKYKMARRESRRKTKQLGHKKLEDF